MRAANWLMTAVSTMRVLLRVLSMHHSITVNWVAMGICEFKCDVGDMFAGAAAS